MSPFITLSEISGESTSPIVIQIDDIVYFSPGNNGARIKIRGEPTGIYVTETVEEITMSIGAIQRARL
jgi:hypothetical protein